MDCIRGDERGHAMTQAIRNGPLTAEARVQSEASPCGNGGGQSGFGTCPLRVVLFSASQDRSKKRSLFIHH
jgi:hypothetical protein